MATLPVHFTFHSGLNQNLLRNIRLEGSWNSQGLYSTTWSETPMVAGTDESGCPAFRATVGLNETQIGSAFQWGVRADSPGGPDDWVIVTEVADANSSERYRTFNLIAADQEEHYWFVQGRYLGAQKWLVPGQVEPAVRFAVWAPHAQKIEVVFAAIDETASATGYISDDGTGIDPTVGRQGAFPLSPQGQGLWQTDLTQSPALTSFANFLGQPYMFRIVNEQGQTTYKTDLYSRNQIGRGNLNPGGGHYAGTYKDLDGDVSCSVVADPDQITSQFNDSDLFKQTLISADDFWSSEFTPGLAPPQSIQDLLIYELHVGSLGFPLTEAGTFADALAFVSELVALGVNAVELLPVLQFDGNIQWGYGTSHFFCLQTSAGGANQLKHFVRACHQSGIAVILDVVYNHFSTSNGERAEWGYDSDPETSPEHNLYYWYEGQSSDYNGNLPGGYLNNGSTGYAPRYSEENVRQMFTSSAAALFDDFHIDGIRVDLTGAIHQDNTLNSDGISVRSANLYGTKLLRELSRTVKLVNPHAFLIAEDHTGWAAMTQPLDEGGIGFDVVWYADFYHHLAGDGNSGDSYARLIKLAGLNSSASLRMDYFAGALTATRNSKVSYHESHDEAGNGENTERTIVTAVNGAALVGETRRYAESRCRLAYGMAALSAGTPMFLMGEEIGAAKYFRHTDFYLNKEDLLGERTGNGRFLFRFYQELNQLIQRQQSLRSRGLDILHVHNENRVIVFRRTWADEQMLIWASVNDLPFTSGYDVEVDPSRLPAGGWKEVFNSDADVYGGDNVGNAGATISAHGGKLSIVIPAHGFVLMQKVS